MGGVTSGVRGWRGGKPSTDSLPVVRITHAERFSMQPSAVHLSIEAPNCGIVSYGQRQWSVKIATTGLQYGGHRRWLCCLECESRRLALYVDGNRLACRVCIGLRYASQHENRRDRAFRVADRVRLALGWKPGILNSPGPKPKRMHWSTYRRLHELLEAQTDAILGSLPEWIERAEKAVQRRKL